MVFLLRLPECSFLQNGTVYVGAKSLTISSEIDEIRRSVWSVKLQTYQGELIGDHKILDWNL